MKTRQELSVDDAFACTPDGNNKQDEVFVRHFLIEENSSYGGLLEVINNRYPNLTGCSLRSVKRFFNYHAMKKRMSDAVGSMAAQGTI